VSNIRTISVAVVGAAAIGLGCGLTPAEAATLDFNFSFTNVANGGGTVTGIVSGLTDNATSAATSLKVLTNTAGFGIGEYVGNPLSNSFTVSAGSITSATFVAFGLGNNPPAVTGSSLALNLNSPLYKNITGLSNTSGSIVVSPNTGLSFTPVTPPTAVPTPALLPGLLGLGAAALRKRKAEQVKAEV